MSLIEQRRQLDRQFFSEMENNIVESMSRGEVIPGNTLTETKKRQGIERGTGTIPRAYNFKHACRSS